MELPVAADHRRSVNCTSLAYVNAISRSKLPHLRILLSRGNFTAGRVVFNSASAGATKNDLHPLLRDKRAVLFDMDGTLVQPDGEGSLCG
jgi:hypothetical protein